MSVLERPFDRLPDPRARRETTPLRGLADSAIEGFWYENLQPVTHMLILT